MIDVSDFVGALNGAGVDFFTGVPDSLLKSFCAYITDHSNPPLSTSTSSPHLTHFIAANEGGAVGLAAGHYLATGKMACVYMQNSGQGNAVNPLASLADPDVYSIPMILLVGWRGMPGVHDEPQHVKQGKITVSLMETLGIPTFVLEDEAYGEVKGQRSEVKQWRIQISDACELAKRESRPVALIVRKGLFAEYKLQNKKPDITELPREKAIEQILDQLPSDAVIVSTTGMISRELYEIRERWEGQRSKVKGQTEELNHLCLTSDLGPLTSFSHSDLRPLTSCHAHDFLTVGSMGHASMIALGIAKAHPDRPVVCLDGDGASIMQMGNMAIVGQSGCVNLTHIVLNNAAHDSVGGQPTVGDAIDLRGIARACGYDVLEKMEVKGGGGQRTSPSFVEIKVAKGARADLGRPKEPPQVNKNLFMSTLAAKKTLAQPLPSGEARTPPLRRCGVSPHHDGGFSGPQK